MFLLLPLLLLRTPAAATSLLPDHFQHCRVRFPADAVLPATAVVADVIDADANIRLNQAPRRQHYYLVTVLKRASNNNFIALRQPTYLFIYYLNFACLIYVESGAYLFSIDV